MMLVFQSRFSKSFFKVVFKVVFQVDGVAHRSHNDYAGCEKPSLARPRNKCGYLKC